MVEGAAKQTPVEKKDVPSEQKQGNPADKLSQEGNSQVRPEQQTANAGADKHLPDLTIDQPQQTAPRLDQQTLTKKAEELHDAIHKESGALFWKHDDPDKDKIFRILEPMSKADREALEKIYEEKYGAGSLRRELKEKLGGDNSVDWRRSEAILNREDGRTNDAGALMVAITHARDDKDKGNAEIRQVFETLNSKQIAQLDEDFKKAYGMSYKEALDKANLTDATKQSLGILEKGVDFKTKEDVAALADIAIKNKDARLFTEALRGDSKAATEFRAMLNANPPSAEAEDFRNRVAEAFKSPIAQMLEQHGGNANDLPRDQRTDQMMLDYMKEGRISLATIASENTSSFLGLLDNKDNIELAARNASDKERQMFNDGRAHANDNPPDPKYHEAIEYYNKIHKAFKEHGNDREVAIYEDQLAHGRETIITQLAKGHDDGWGPFNWGAGHSMQDLMTKVENLSQDDWKALHDERNANPPSDTFRKQIEDSLKYADEGERKRIMDLLDRKAGANSFEDAAKIGRTLDETIGDNKGNAFLWFGTSYNGKNILNKIESINPDEAQKYKNDPEFRDKLNNFVKENMSGEERQLAERLLSKVAQDGQPPKKDATDTLLHDKINGAKPEQLLKDAEALLKADPALRERLKGSNDQLSDDEKRIKNVIEDSLFSASMTNGGYPPDGYYAGNEYNYSKYRDQLFSAEGLSLQSKLELGYPKNELIPEIAKAPQAQREEAMKNLSEQERAIITAAQSNNPPGELTLADKMRLYNVSGAGDPAQFKAALSELAKGDHSGIQKLKDEYNRKYGSDLDNDFLKKIKDDKEFGKEVNSFKDLLTPSESDGRQRFYDNYRDALKSLGTGVSADGSSLTVQRSLDEYANQLEHYQSIYKTLPKEKQEALDKFFNDSLEQYKQSKEKLAELVTTVVITAAALAAAPFTGGTSLLVVGSIAFAAGAAAKVLIKAGIEGGDYDWTKAFGDAGKGGFEAVLNVVGGKIAEGMFKGFNVAGKGLYGELLDQGLVKAGSEVSEQTASKAFTELIAAGKNVTPEALERFAATVAPGASAAEKASIQRLAMQAVEQNYDAVINRATRVALSGVDNAIIGGGSAATATIVNATIDGRPLSADEILKQAFVGAATGAVIGTVIHGAIEGRDLYVKARKTPDGEVILPAGPGEKPVKLQDSQGNVREVTTETKPEPGERIVDGPDYERMPESAANRERSTLQGDNTRANWQSDGVVNPQQPFKDYSLGSNGVEIPITKQKITLGRDGSTDIVRAGDQVSRNHAEIEFTKDGPVIRDLNSSNGTFVNGRRLDAGSEVHLKPGDRIRLANDTEFVFGEKYRGDAYQAHTVEYNGQKLDLNSNHITLGRSRDSGLVFNEDVVSRNHAEINFTEHGPVLKNGQPTNGTFVNGRQLQPGEEVVLKPGDKIKLGNTGPELVWREKSFDVPEGPRVVQEYQPRGTNNAAKPEAVRQSNEYGDKYEQWEPFEDGWQRPSGRARVEADGTFHDPNRPSTVVDRTQDKVLNDTIKEAHQRYQRIAEDAAELQRAGRIQEANAKYKELAEELAKFSKRKMNPRGWDENMVDQAYNQFYSANGGKRILLGDFIDQAARGQGAGVCSQQAILFKVLMDDFAKTVPGLEVNTALIRGFSGPKANASGTNHAWNEIEINGQKFVFDPRQEYYGKTYDQLPMHTPGRDLPGARVHEAQKLALNEHLRAGSEVQFQGQKWQVIGVDKDGALLQAPAVKPISPMDFQRANPGVPPRIGQRFNVYRSDGTFETGWRFDGYNADGTMRMYHESGLRQRVSADDIVAENPHIGGGERASRSESAIRNDLKPETKTDDFLLGLEDSLGADGLHDEATAALMKRIEGGDPELFANAATIGRLQASVDLIEDPVLKAKFWEGVFKHAPKEALHDNQLLNDISATYHTSQNKDAFRQMVMDRVTSEMDNNLTPADLGTLAEVSRMVEIRGANEAISNKFYDQLQRISRNRITPQELAMLRDFQGLAGNNASNNMLGIYERALAARDRRAFASSRHDWRALEKIDTVLNQEQLDKLWNVLEVRAGWSGNRLSEADWKNMLNDLGLQSKESGKEYMLYWAGTNTRLNNPATHENIGHAGFHSRSASNGLDQVYPNKMFDALIELAKRGQLR